MKSVYDIDNIGITTVQNGTDYLDWTYNDDGDIVINKDGVDLAKGIFIRR